MTGSHRVTVLFVAAALSSTHVPTEAIRLNANDPRPYFFPGYAYQRLKEYDRAIADFNDAIRLHPKAATYYYQRGKAYEAKGDQEHANADFEQAKRLGP